MSKKTRKKLTKEIKEQAVFDYVSGAKTASQIALELGVGIRSVYQWRTSLNDKKRDQKISSFEAEGMPREIAERLIQKEEEILEYQKKVAEQAVIIDLLKKLQTSVNYRPESELSGLIATSRKSDRKRKRVK